MIFWKNYDTDECKDEPTRYISIPTHSFLTKRDYAIQVKVCEKHYQEEKDNLSCKMEKTRPRIKRLLEVKN